MAAKFETKHIEKMGLERFLQLVPQDSGICAILRNSKKSEVMTLDEWKNTVSDLLHRSVIR